MKNAEKLLFALNNVDNKYIDEANNREKEKKNIAGVFEKIGAVAAVLVLVAFAVVMVNIAQRSNNIDKSGSGGKPRIIQTEDGIDVNIIPYETVLKIREATVTSRKKEKSYVFYLDDARTLASFFSPLHAKSVQEQNWTGKDTVWTVKFYFNDMTTNHITLYVTDYLRVDGETDFYELGDENRQAFETLLGDIARENYTLTSIISENRLKEITEISVAPVPGDVTYDFDGADAAAVASYFTSMKVITVSDSDKEKVADSLTVKIKYSDGTTESVYLNLHIAGADSNLIVHRDGDAEYYDLNYEDYFAFKDLMRNTARKEYGKNVSFISEDEIKRLDKVRVFSDVRNIDYEYKGEYAAELASKFVSMKPDSVYYKNNYDDYGLEIKFSFKDGTERSLYYNGSLISCKGSEIKYEFEEDGYHDFMYYLSYLQSMQNAAEITPDDFSFRISWGIYGDMSSYNSKTGKLVKSTKAKDDPSKFVTEHKMTKKEINALYTILLKNIDVFSYPDDYDPCNAPGTVNKVRTIPYQTIIIQVEYKGAVKRIECNDICLGGERTGYNDEAKAFLRAVTDIQAFLMSTDEWKALPERDFKYY